MCFNRYCAAQGLRNYSLETWKELFPTSGRDLLAKHANSVMPFYCEQAQSQDRTSREAACNCISEVMTKVVPGNPEPFRTHIPVVTMALHKCLDDSVWSVRDSAAYALGHVV